MKKLTLLVFVGIATISFAQKVTVDKKSEKVKGESAEGYSTELEAKKDDVAAAFSRFIKDLGKVKSGNDYQYVEGPALGGTVYTTGVVYGRTRGNEERATVWLGIKSAEWTVNDISLVENQLEKLIYQFGVKFYRDKIQLQIDEGQRAMDAVVRQQTRLVNQNKELNIKLGNNVQEKIHLDQSLEANKLENLVLIQKIENNKHDQDSVKLAGEQIKKVIEAHKERQRKVN
ncbi:MAG TPA: hypothetical protein PLR06_03595 [Cyclobacteriaceae bacterium]|nr:hypothetical protein [Cyclobacteriaceae bacterium]